MASGERTKAANTSPATTPPAPPSSPATTSAPATSAGQGTSDWRQRGEDSSRSAPTEGPSIVDGLRCDLLMNARYHASREAFLDTVHRFLMFMIIILGAAAVTELVNAPWLKGAFAASAVVFAAFDLTADLSNRARCHALMKRRYFELLADLIGEKRSPVD